MQKDDKGTNPWPSRIVAEQQLISTVILVRLFYPRRFAISGPGYGQVSQSSVVVVDTHRSIRRFKRLAGVVHVFVIGLALGASPAQAWNVVNMAPTFGEVNNSLFTTFPFNGGAPALTFLQADAGGALNFNYRQWSTTTPGQILVPNDPVGPLQAWPANPWEVTATSNGITFAAHAFDNVTTLPGGVLVSGADLRATATGSASPGADGQASWGRQFEVTVAAGQIADFAIDVQASITMAPTDIGTGISRVKLLNYDAANQQWNFNNPLAELLISEDQPGSSQSTFLKLRYTFDNSAGTTDLVERVWLEGSAIISAPIPEPHEHALMLAGLGLVGLIARRRKRI
jgi:PEP-CTERM motif